MKNRKILIGTVLILAVAFLAVWLLGDTLFSESPVLSSDDIREIVIEQYPGEILGINQTDEEYIVQLLYNQGEYELKINGATGEIISLIQTVQSDPGVGENPLSLLTEEEAIEIAFSHNSGTLVSLTLMDEEPKVYVAVTETESAKTTITIDAVSGKILSSTETVKSSGRAISETEAGDIAMKHVQGIEVDDIEYRENGSNSFFLVEINLANGEEAKVQVHSITGSVMSVAWDD